MSDSIKAWLSGACDYNEGVALYAACPGALPNLVRLFSKGKTQYNNDKLRAELQRLANAKIQPVQTPKTVLKTERVAVARLTVQDAKNIAENRIKQVRKPLMFNDLPAELHPVYKRTLDLFFENCMLKTQLNALPANEEKEAQRIQIIIWDNWAEHAACYKRIDYFLQHRKVLPEVSKFPKHDDLTPAGMVKRQNQLFSAISMSKKRLAEYYDKIKSPESIGQRTKLQKNIAKQEASIIAKEAELKHLTDKING